MRRRGLACASGVVGGLVDGLVGTVRVVSVKYERCEGAIWTSRWHLAWLPAGSVAMYVSLVDCSAHTGNTP